MRICVQNGGITNRLGIDEGYRLIAEAGFEAIDWNIDVHLANDKVAKAPVLKDLCIFDKPLDQMLEFFAPELDAIGRNGLQISQAHAPFTGVTDWREFVDSLRDIGYEGDLSFETFGQVNDMRMDTDLIPLFVKHIANIGNYFRDKILG